jgi:farnesyl-diphosphate farnesyltransferase
MLVSRTDARDATLPDRERLSDVEFCEAMLPLVSRTFTLNIGILPGRLRDPVRIAYLFCRMADTVEDSAYLPVGEKHELLARLGSLPALAPGWEEEVDSLAGRFEDPPGPGDADWHLCAGALSAFRAFSRLDREEREPIALCLKEMTEGMSRYLPPLETRDEAGVPARGGPGDRTWFALDRVDDLLGYSHAVAGTVGEMLCRLFAAHSERISPRLLRQLEARAVSFGHALQLTNIVKDVNRDRLRGRSFIPEQIAARHGLSTRELWNAAEGPRARRALLDVIDLALEHFDQAFHYSVLLPKREVRIRLFCLWPLFLALRTLGAVLVRSNPFMGAESIKISRAEVQRTLQMTSLASLSNRWLGRLYQSRKRVLTAALSLSPGS